MEKSVFLTGGSGRIGKRVLKKLLDRGYRVKALMHRNKPEGISGEKLEFVQGDIMRQKDMIEAAEDCQIICHLAATYDMFPPVVFEKENDTIFDNIVHGTYNLLEAANRMETCDLFLFASTDAVYATGPQRYDSPITEDIELHPCPGRFYAAAKAATESLCINYGKTFEVPWSIIRINWALEEDEILKVFTYEFWEDDLDPKDRERLRPKLADGKGLFCPEFVSGEPAVEQIAYPEDTAEGFVLAIANCEASRGNIFNIAAPKPFRYQEIVEKISKSLGVPYDSAKVSGYEPYSISNAKAERLLGYNPQYPMKRLIDLALTNQQSKDG